MRIRSATEIPMTRCESLHNSFKIVITSTLSKVVPIDVNIEQASARNRNLMFNLAARVNTGNMSREARSITTYNAKRCVAILLTNGGGMDESNH